MSTSLKYKTTTTNNHTPTKNIIYTANLVSRIISQISVLFS